MNPLDENGEPLKCLCCKSERHFVADCPHTYENDGKEKSVNVVQDQDQDQDKDQSVESIVCYTGKDRILMNTLTQEALNSVVIDSACSSTVCGELWYNNFKESLDSERRKKIVEGVGVKVFRFGGGERLKSIRSAVIPVELAGHAVKLNLDVVESDLPLLLSKPAMKKLRFKMDLEQDTGEILGTPVTMNITSSGHYCIPIGVDSVTQEEVYKVSLEGDTIEDRKANLKHIHRQFGHPSRERLSNLLKDANLWNKEIRMGLDEIYENCEICVRFQRNKSKPIVGLPSAKQFNDIVRLDMKQ